MKKIISILLSLTIVLILNSCSEDSKDSNNLNYVALHQNFVAEVLPDGNESFDFPVYATKIENFDRTFEVSLIEASSTADPSAYSIPSTVTIPAGKSTGYLTIDAVGENISSSGSDVIVLQIVSTNGILVGPRATVSLKHLCLNIPVMLEITFDGYASETSWELEDGDGNIVYSAAEGTYSDGQAKAITTFCLTPGTYTFTINDAYGDGLSYPADGTISISNGGTELVNIVGDFGDTYSETFTIE